MTEVSFVWLVVFNTLYTLYFLLVTD